MGNCYARQQQSQHNHDYIDKNIRVQREIGAGISISKSAKKIGFDSEISGKITSTREEKYVSSIPSVLDIVNS